MHTQKMLGVRGGDRFVHHPDLITKKLYKIFILYF